MQDVRELCAYGMRNVACSMCGGVELSVNVNTVGGWIV